jgi:hypothetical protein
MGHALSQFLSFRIPGKSGLVSQAISLYRPFRFDWGFNFLFGRYIDPTRDWESWQFLLARPLGYATVLGAVLSLLFLVAAPEELLRPRVSLCIVQLESSKARQASGQG